MNHARVCLNLITGITAFSRLVRLFLVVDFLCWQGRHFLKSQSQHVVSSKCQSVTLEQASVRVSLFLRLRDSRFEQSYIFNAASSNSKYFVYLLLTRIKAVHAVTFEISDFQGSRSYPRIIP
jgi:hypothetical protein